MDGVGRNGADVRFNCSSICINDEHIRGQFGGHSLVETSCKPEPHVFHLGCITRHLDKQSETSLHKRQCSECGQPALPLIRKDGESVDDDESPYCESRMLNVCRSGNLSTLNCYLEKDKTLANQPYRSALTGHPEYLLAVALKHQHTDLARTLIDHGADVNAADGKGQTPLHITAANGDKTCLKKLIEKGAKVNATNNNGETALHIATKISKTKGRQQCAAMGIDITGTLINGKTFDNYTIEKENDIGCLRELADNRGVDINARDNDGITPLMIAALWGKLDHMTYLLERADFNIADNSGNTALHLAACWGQTDCLRKLLDKKVDVNVKTHIDGATPLHMAAQNGHIESVKELLKNDQTSVNEQMNNGCTALHLAASGDHTEAIQTLLAFDRSLAKEKDNDGQTALHLAAYKGHTEAIQTLLTIPSSQAKKKEKNKSVRTALTAAVNATAFAVRTALAAAVNATAFAVHTEATQPLQTIDPSLAKEKDNEGQTALHKAASQGHTKAIQTLLKIDPSLVKETDNLGRMAVHLAADESHIEAIQILQSSLWEK
ncbi:ankyrin repeat domain-containing protein [Thalassotalea sp. G20_0]|uniref:ankyrin repeat domain-containing protein n=1 Tax=Thalassotalea sp. G20_0 TaxID=2821093 RepID=UPI001ADBE119|nr:ankyrin repeat domain-containing protein [Thalassotalea sp. G20_0]MBO9497203.1 ankyrin repeat domain-containing protein [Thalassotalea sp. G20_0]